LLWVFLFASLTGDAGIQAAKAYFRTSLHHNFCMKKNLLLLSSVALVLSALLSLSFTREKRYSRPGTPSDTTALPSFAMAKDHQGKNVVNANGFITVTTGLDNDYFRVDSGGRTGYLYLETRMGRFVHEAAKRNPLNISIVIDRSGSMAGEKMDFAKKAAAGIIDQLTPEDFVSVVIYDEYIDLIQAATPVLHKDSIKFKIARIKPRGSTNLWGGSERGYEQVLANYRKNYINRVLLISDGLITAGVKIPSRIMTKVQEYKDIEGITISTFGVGLDYNETLMTGMAENGAGNYYFIDRADKMTPMFDKELRGLLNVVAQDAELRITLPKGVTVEKLYPFKFGQVKNEVVIKFRDLSSEESKSLVLQFRLDDNVEKELRFLSKLAYTDIADKQQKEVINENLLLPIKNVDTYLAHFNRKVAEQVVLFTANENMERAMLEADKKNYEAARKVAEANSYFFSNNATYVSASRELQKMDSVNRFYTDDLTRAKTMTADSLKLMQKSKRSVNYQIRTKKY
jgi:Ca-activated chloride channel homolog